jgi:hypothetical protein
MKQEKSTDKIMSFKRYPLSHVFIYNGIMAIHVLLGTMGIIYGYDFTWAGKLIGYSYLAFAFIQWVVVMPLTVCPACDYFRNRESRCISGFNIISKRIWNRPEKKDLSRRNKGFFCHNHLVVMSLVIPIVIMIHALIFNFSLFLLFLLIIVIGLMLFRILVILPRLACIHCLAKKKCPNADLIGIL